MASSCTLTGKSWNRGGRLNTQKLVADRMATFTPAKLPAGS
jgi:hypothetical protein